MSISSEKETRRSEGVSRQELLAKAEQLQKPCSLAARARTGLCYLLLGKPETWARELITDGKRFLQILLKDVECEEFLRTLPPGEPPVLLTDNKERFYRPSEVLPTSVPDLKKRIVNDGKILDNLTNPSTRGLVSNKEIKKALDDLVTFSERYIERTGEALGEYKYGPLVRIGPSKSSSF